jgi:serine protease Do
MTWLLLAIALLFLLGGVLTAFRGNRESARTEITAEETRSYFGAHEFVDADGGVTFNDVEPPGSPADKAGLVGGDIVTSFDGHTVKNRYEMMDLLTRTPPGKTVEVIYLRDGETRKARLTTISREQFSNLVEDFAERYGGHGLLGFNEGSSDHVQINDTKLQGVRLGDLRPNGPAALAGLIEGDIITEFDGVPIRTVGELVSRVGRAQPYSAVKVIAFRSAERLELTVKLGKRG